MLLDVTTKQVIGLCRGVGIFIRQELQKVSHKDVEIKGLHDLVTYVDKTAEDRLKKELSKILPEAGFVAEESPEEKRAEKYNWIVDPLDGTTNFIHKIPTFSISIALLDGEEVILGVVYEIIRDECFYSWKGAKAYMNETIINVTNTKKMDESLWGTGFPFRDFSRFDNYLEAFKYLIYNTRGVRRIGTAATDLAYVACGRFDGFFEYGLNPWDVSAGAFIVKQAGGKVSDFSGKSNFLFGKEIFASNPYLFDEFMEVLKKSFKS
ncbi:MAG: inositol monophosphatase [Bacteroidales bacterium]